MDIATLSLSHEVTDKGLVIRASVTNTSAADLYVLDRPWRLDKSSQKAADAEPLYRFVRGADLRLLLGAAPLPRRYSVAYRNVPHATRVAAGATHTIERALALPIKEYSPYFPENDEKAYERVEAETLHVLVQVIAHKAGLETVPSTATPGAVEIKSPVAALADARLLVAEAKLAVPALRRTDMFDRVVLPGEAQEPL